MSRDPSRARGADAASIRRRRVLIWIQAAVVAVLLVQLVAGGGLPILRQWALFALGALRFPLAIWHADGPATVLTTATYLAKLFLALAPTLVVIRAVPTWRIGACLFAMVVVAISVSFVRACPAAWQWIALVILSGAGCVLVRYRFQRWAVGLPLLVLVVLPAAQHGSAWNEGPALVARCAANDGQRPINLDASHLTPRYYGVHPFPPDWILLTGETPQDGQFMGLPHGGRGSWWLRRDADGHLIIDSPSSATGNIWTGCRLGDDGWLIRAGMFMQIRPPGPDGRESVRRLPVTIAGFDAPDTACDPRTGTVYASDLLDGRLTELTPASGNPPRRRQDAVSVRGGLMTVREQDGQLLMLDFQDLIVYDLAAGQVRHHTPAATVSSSLTLCQQDGAVAVPDLAGRLRVFRMDASGGYVLDWAMPLFAPRAAQFSPDCAFLGVTSADDSRVWIIDRATQRIVREYHLGPTIRGAAFTGPRELAVADACTLSLLTF